MKKQWLSIVLVLCMVLCMAPTTARAEESKTGTLEITVDISGVYEGDNVGDKTFSFEILRKYANYGHYKYVDITIKSGETKHTEYVPVEEGKYVVKQTSHATIDKYDWENASHQPGNTVESIELNVYAGKTERVTVHNFYEIAVTKEITELPITVTGYALGAKVSGINTSTEQMRVTINNNFTIKQRNVSGGWDNLASDATIQENIQYAVEIFVNAKTGYTYTGLTGDKVTVNGKKASEFEKNPSTQPGVDMRVFHELEVLKVVKKVDHIEITTPPTKTVYKGGDKFDPTGMVVTAVYKDGTSKPITNYIIFHGDKLTKGQEYVTIQYDDGSGNSDIKVRQTITVGAYEGPHTHTYAGSPWYQDATSHWHQCTDSTCPDPRASATELASHTFVWKVDQAATTTQTGLKHEECTVCKKVLETATIPATHTHSYGTDWKYDDTNHWHECECRDKADTAAHSFQWVIDKAATKKATGIKHEECTVCGAKRSENTVIDKLSDNGSTGNTGSGNNNTDKPGKDDSTKSPQTGDSSNLIGWLAALFVSGGVLTVLGLNGKKRKESEDE